jgi:hypothetical protein
MSAVYGPALVHHRGSYGNAILTRWPVKGVRRVEIGVVGREPRAVLDTQIEVAGRDLRVVATHFGLRSAERRFQTEMLVRMLGHASDAPLIVLGDFNDVEGRARLTLAPASTQLIGPVARRGRASRRGCRLLALDRIWVRPARALVALRAHRSRLAPRASDHLPVLATVELRRDAPAESGSPGSRSRSDSSRPWPGCSGDELRALDPREIHGGRCAICRRLASRSALCLTALGLCRARELRPARVAPAGVRLPRAQRTRSRS